MVQVNATGTPLFTLGAGFTLAIQDLTLKGMDGNSVPVVKVNSGGTLKMKTGSLITGNTTGNGAAICKKSGTDYRVEGHTLTLHITKSGIPWSKVIRFTITHH